MYYRSYFINNIRTRASWHGFESYFGLINFQIIELGISILNAPRYTRALLVTLITKRIMYYKDYWV